MSLKVVPGDVLDVETLAYYEGTSGYGSLTGSSAMIAAVASAFGGVNGAAGEAVDIFDGISSWIGAAGAANGGGEEDWPAAYLNIILFDEDYNTYGQPMFVRVDDSNPFVKHQLISVHLDVETLAYYEGTSGYGSLTGSSAMIAAVASAFGGVNGAAGEAVDIFDGISSWIGAVGAANGGGEEDWPAAYLNIILFDEDYNTYGQPMFVRVDDSNPFVKHQLINVQICKLLIIMTKKRNLARMATNRSLIKMIRQQ